MNALFYTLFFLFSLGQLGRISLLSGQVNFYLFEPIILLLLMIFVFRHRLTPIINGYQNLKMIYFFNAFLVVSYVAGIFAYSTNQNLVALLYLARLIVYQIFFLYLHYYLKTTKTIKIFKRGFYLGIVLVAISSLVQYFFYPDLRNLFYQGWDPHLNRLFGVFFDTGLAASFYGLISLYFYKRKNIFAAFMFLIFLVLTFSRAAYLFFIITIVVDFMKSRNIKYLIFILFSFFMIFYFAPKEFGQGVGLDRVFSVTSRFADYGKAFKAFSKSPIIGYGYNRTQAVKEKFNLTETNILEIPDHAAASFSSSYLIILVSSGLIGLVLFVISIYRMALFKNLSVYFLFLGMISCADNILLHPMIIVALGSIAMVSLLYDK